jgi:hypothetical protein
MAAADGKSGGPSLSKDINPTPPESAFTHVAPPVPIPNSMNAAAMSLELHGCGIHAV